MVGQFGNLFEIRTFYTRSPNNRDGGSIVLSDILGANASDLESVKNYVQLAFPLPEISNSHPDVPIIDAEVFATFQGNESPHMKRQLRQVFEKMMWFYGFEVAGRDTNQPQYKIVKTAQYDTLAPNYNVKHNHNHRRITRILRSVRILGMDEEAKAFQTILAQYSGNVNNTSHVFWYHASYGPLHIPPGYQYDTPDPRSFIDFGKDFLRGGIDALLEERRGTMRRSLPQQRNDAMFTRGFKGPEDEAKFLRNTVPHEPNSTATFVGTINDAGRTMTNAVMNDAYPQQIIRNAGPSPTAASVPFSTPRIDPTRLQVPLSQTGGSRLSNAGPASPTHSQVPQTGGTRVSNARSDPPTRSIPPPTPGTNTTRLRSTQVGNNGGTSTVESRRKARAAAEAAATAGTTAQVPAHIQAAPSQFMPTTSSKRGAFLDNTIPVGQRTSSIVGSIPPNTGTASRFTPMTSSKRGAIFNSPVFNGQQSLVGVSSTPRNQSTHTSESSFFAGDTSSDEEAVDRPIIKEVREAWEKSHPYNMAYIRFMTLEHKDYSDKPLSVTMQAFEDLVTKDIRKEQKEEREIKRKRAKMQRVIDRDRIFGNADEISEQVHGVGHVKPTKAFYTQEFVVYADGPADRLPNPIPGILRTETPRIIPFSTSTPTTQKPRVHFTPTTEKPRFPTPASSPVTQTPPEKPKTTKDRPNVVEIPVPGPPDTTTGPYIAQRPRGPERPRVVETPVPIRPTATITRPHGTRKPPREARRPKVAETPVPISPTTPSSSESNISTIPDDPTSIMYILFMIIFILWCLLAMYYMMFGTVTPEL